LNKRAGLEEITDVIKSDFMALPLTHNSIDAAYAIEATCHAPDRTGCFRQIYNTLKPGKIHITS
jgi:sterol 24-C-methyltransferase